MKKIWWWWFLVLFLSACGGGGDSLFYGDSTEAGTRITTNPSAEANKQLIEWGYGSTHSAAHEAVGGSTAEMLLHGRERLHPEHFSITIANEPAAIVGFRYGINERREGWTHEQFKGHLRQLISLSLAAEKGVILATPSPADPTIIGPNLVAYIEASAVAIREVAAEYPSVVLCDHNQRAKDYGILGTVDGLHPDVRATIFQGRYQARCVLQASRRLARERQRNS
jgi:hypothetical protein